jgi:hypothetical protein
MRRALNITVGKPHWKRRNGEIRRMWKNIINMYVGEIGSECGSWINWLTDMGPMGDCCQQGYKYPGFIKSGDILTSWVITLYLLRRYLQG